MIFFFVGFGAPRYYDEPRLLTGLQSAFPFLCALVSAIVASIVFYKLEKMEEQVKMHEYALQQLRKELNKLKDPYAKVYPSNNITIQQQEEVTPQQRPEITNTTNTYGRLV